MLLTLYSLPGILSGESIVEVIYTDEFEQWWLGLPVVDQEAVAFVVGLLEQRGVQLGFPYSSQIKGASFPLRELRSQRHNKPLRVFYAFDPARDAVLLIGGDKSGDNQFYERMVSRSETIWRQYLKELDQEDRATDRGRKE